MDTSFKSILSRLTPCYPEGEARALARHVLEVRFGVTQTDICTGRERAFSLEERQELENIVNRLLRKEPVQYILGQADFCNRTFTVAPGVLIPRPETEELIGWIVREERHTPPPSRALDIGTGSGCIAVTLALELPQTCMTALDISPAALDITRRNAAALHAQVDFRRCDILATEADLPAVPSWDFIVSNPPYICERERREMDDNVLLYEPAQALFVPDQDPLLFYRAIGQYALRTLKEGGRLYVEINRAYGHETSGLFQQLGLRDICLKKDIYGNERMVQCKK